MLDIIINWRDNPWYNEVLEDERQTLKRLNKDLYDHVWEGQLRTAAGLLFKRVWFKRYEPGAHPEHLTAYLFLAPSAVNFLQRHLSGRPVASNC